MRRGRLQRGDALFEHADAVCPGDRAGHGRHRRGALRVELPRVDLLQRGEQCPYAAPNPTAGEMTSQSKTLPAWAQSTPAVPFPSSKLFASPTPRIEPIRVWELLTGRPMYQVPRFQITPAIRRERTIARAAPGLLSMRRSTGSRLTMLKAIAVPPSRTPRKLHAPE